MMDEQQNQPEANQRSNDQTENTTISQTIDNTADTTIVGSTIQQKEEQVRSFKEQQEDNFKRYREKVEEQARQSKAQINALNQQVEHMKISTATQIGDDDVAEGRHISAVSKQIEELRKEMYERDQIQQQVQDDLRIKSEFSDATEVICKKNLDILKEKYPHLHANLMQSPGGTYAKAKVAYTLITEMGIREQTATENRIDENLAKPAVGRGNALSQKHLYDNDSFGAEERKAHMKLVNSYIKGG